MTPGTRSQAALTAGCTSERINLGCFCSKEEMMSALYWRSEVRVLREALANIGELKPVVSVEVGRDGFADVRHNQLEVAGGKNGCWISIAHFHIGDARFWEVVMGGGDNF